MILFTRIHHSRQTRLMKTRRLPTLMLFFEHRTILLIRIRWTCDASNGAVLSKPLGPRNLAGKCRGARLFAAGYSGQLPDLVTQLLDMIERFRENI